MITKEEALQELNLNSKEINIYLSLLMLGQSTVSSIAKKAKLNRVSTYDLLKSLLERGFVSYVIKSGVRYFEAVEPSRFLDNLKEKQEKIKQILPELEAIKSTLTEKPQIEMYEEIKGLKSIFNDILKENKETWFIGDPEMLDSLKFYFPHFINQKRKQDIFSKVITYDNKAMRNYQAPKKYMEMRFINEKIEMTKIIYGNKVAFLTFKEKDSIGLLINNKQITNTEKKLFKLLWKNCKKKK
ncbi:hypothetical protein HOC13_04695 [Candidatus Woesearchaeota archaeon]|jgi:HTH-type transcriptional regulator, sugar sensing transcriptional regulator|nr:hypothetical protein [Candidatus Woesearchaeota archaeon]